MELVTRLDWDSNFFGLNVFTTTEKNLSRKQLKSLDQVSKEKSIDVLYHFQELNSVDGITLLGLNRFQLIEQKVDLVLNASKAKIDETEADQVKLFNDKEYNIGRLYLIARQVSSYSRFANDRHFNREQVGQLYKLWIDNSYYNGFADKIFISLSDNQISGFCIIKVENDHAIRISLIGVDEAVRGRSLGTKILQTVFRYYFSRGYEKCFVSTQLRNINALNFYIKNRFEICDAKLVFHKWYKEVSLNEDSI